MAKMGRPIELTDEIQKKIVDAIKMGNYIETAASYAGVHKSTLYDWMKRGARYEEGKSDPGDIIFANFSDAIERAMTEAEMRDVLLIGNAAKKNWQAAAWRLERKFPDKWGRKDRVNLEHSGALEVNGSLDVRLNHMTDEEVEAALKKLKAQDDGDE